MSRTVVELLNNLEKNASANSFSAAVGNATKNFMKQNMGGGPMGNNQDADRIPKSKYWQEQKPIEETLEASEKGHPVSKDVTAVDEAIRNQEESSMNKLAKLKEINALKDIRMAKYKEAGFKKITKNVGDFITNPAGGEGFKGGLRQAGKKSLWGIPLAAGAATDQFVEDKLDNLALRGWADLSAAAVINPKLYRRIKKGKIDKNIENLMSGSSDKLKYMDEYAENVLKKNPVKMTQREQSMAARFARDRIANNEALHGTTIDTLKDQAKYGVYATAAPVAIGTGHQVMEKVKDVGDIITEPVEAPVLDPVTGKPKLDDEGNPIMTMKPRMSAFGDTVGSSASRLAGGAENIEGSLESMSGEDNFMDKLNQMGGDVKEYWDVFKEVGPEQISNAVGFLNKNKIAVGAGAIGLGTLFLYLRKRKEEEERKKREEEERRLRLQDRAFQRIAQM
jgi:hypothetical protein